MPNLPTVAQGANYVWTADCDNQGNYINTKSVNVTQNVIASIPNSSTTNLNSGASFTGTSDSTLGVNSIQVSLFADQNCTIQVQQAQESPTGINWNIIDTWTYSANSSAQDATRTVQALGATFRTIVTNNGAVATTAFRLTSIVCPFADPMPRNLTQLGNLRVALLEQSGFTTRAIAAGTVANTVVKATPGTFGGILIVAVGTNAVQVFDNATTNAGTVVGASIASAPIGVVQSPVVACVNGITVAGNAANPQMTIFFN